MIDRSELLTEFIRARFARQFEHSLLASHQQTALTRSMEMIRRRGGAILADEPGMGKSFVAAAVALLFHREGLDLELIVPASLRGQWIETLRRFELSESSILSHESLHRRPAGIRAHRSRLVVVDEAHRFRNPQTKRYRALCERVIGQPVLLVTATPVCNRLEDLLALLRIYASDDILRQEGIPSLTRLFAEAESEPLQRMIEELVIRRTRELLPEALSFADVERKVVAFEVEQGEQISAGIDELRFPLIVRPGERRLLRMLLWKRLESSQAALRESLVRQRRFYRRALEAGADGCRLTKREFLRVFGDHGEDVPFQDLMFRAFWFQPGGGREEDVVAIERELAAIEGILGILRESASLKVQALIALCEDLDEKRILIFTSAIATARVVYESLRPGRRAALVTSGRALFARDVCTKEYAFHQFGAGRLDLLVATDLASEGLNLQAANVVIHFDLPWNPVKFDQRNARAARIGQKAGVRAYYFVPSNRRDRRHSLRTISSKAHMVRTLFGRGSKGWVPSAIRGQALLESSMMRACEERFKSPLPTTRAAAMGDGSPFVRFREITGAEIVERIAIVDGGRLQFDWARIGGAISSETTTACDSVYVDPAIQDHRLRLENRFVMPGRIAAQPRLTLRRKLELLGIWGNRWGGLLAACYCDGVESAIRVAAEGELTRETAENLADMLTANCTVHPSFVRLQRVL
ncbi:MAG TPA: DEAD/DEAH box helicase [Thermoanaerobaculia bacterium]|nr:DEAD/DEAH box helicase [Thermoanaerobaculia bacterium]